MTSIKQIKAYIWTNGRINNNGDVFKTCLYNSSFRVTHKGRLFSGTKPETFGSGLHEIFLKNHLLPRNEEARVCSGNTKVMLCTCTFHFTVAWPCANEITTTAVNYSESTCCVSTKCASVAPLLQSANKHPVSTQGNQLTSTLAIKMLPCK